MGKPLKYIIHAGSGAAAVCLCMSSRPHVHILGVTKTQDTDNNGGESERKAQDVGPDGGAGKCQCI